MNCTETMYTTKEELSAPAHFGHYIKLKSAKEFEKPANVFKKINNVSLGFMTKTFDWTLLIIFGIFEVLFKIVTNNVVKNVTLAILEILSELFVYLILAVTAIMITVVSYIQEDFDNKRREKEMKEFPAAAK